MITRNAAKRTPPAKTPPNPPESSTPKSSARKRKTKQANISETTPTTSTNSDIDLAVDSVTTPITKASSGTKSTRGRKTAARTKTPSSARAASRQTIQSGETGKVNIEEPVKQEDVGDVKDMDFAKQEEPMLAAGEEPAIIEESTSENVEKSSSGESVKVNIEEPVKQEDVGEVKDMDFAKQEEPMLAAREEPAMIEESTYENVEESSSGQTGKVNIEEPVMQEDISEVKDMDLAKHEEPMVVVGEEPAMIKESTYENVEESSSGPTGKVNIEEPVMQEDIGEVKDMDLATHEEPMLVVGEEPSMIEESTYENVEESSKKQDMDFAKQEEPVLVVGEEPAMIEESTSLNVEEFSKKQDMDLPKQEEPMFVVEEEPAMIEESSKKQDMDFVKQEEPMLVVEEEPAVIEESKSQNVEESSKKKDMDFAKQDEPILVVEEEPAMIEQSKLQNVEESSKKQDMDFAKQEEPMLVVGEEPAMIEESNSENVGESSKKKNMDFPNQEEPMLVVGEEPAMIEESTSLNVEESSKKQDMDFAKQEQLFLVVGEESAKNEESTSENVEEPSKKQDHIVTDVDEALKEEGAETQVDKEQPLVVPAGISMKQEDFPIVANVVGSSEIQQSDIAVGGEEAKENVEEIENSGDLMGSKHEPVNLEESTNEIVRGEAYKELEGVESDVAMRGEEAKEDVEEIGYTEDIVGSKHEPVNMEESPNEVLSGDSCKKLEVSSYGGENSMEEFRDPDIIEELKEEGIVAATALERVEQAEALEEEHVELTDAAKERKIKKELEIFVGGLDRNAVEEDVKKAFEKIGDVVEVRLHKNPTNNKNKGYAFVKFATKEQATRALSEMKNPLICGKLCGTAPSEDNNTLFLGNVCNTWTKEAINRKLKDYGIEGVENITLVQDAQHEGLSRGFAFLEFSCHADAMLAYKRLQKPDVVFGHPERTAKVAFAEPLREPDPEVMAQVKSVFIDGLPNHWDEEQVRELFKSYGEIERVMLSRNMSSAKRKDFGFVDFTTHGAAVACIEGTNNKELGDENTKTRVRARLSNPSPKTQAVKGGMCGGFRIGHGIHGSASRFGRGPGRATSFSRGNFQRGRGLYQHGRGQSGRFGFPNVHDFDNQYPPFQGSQMFARGGRWGSFRAANPFTEAGVAPPRSNLDRSWHGASDRGGGRHIPTRRLPFSPEEGFSRPFLGRHVDEPSFYDDGSPGMKRPFYMMDPDYLEPSRVRPRIDYSDPAVSFRGRHPDASGAGTGLNSHYYHGSDYDGGAYSSFYGGNRPYGRGYY